jgi:DNA-nicking Smr family endonuclease
MKQKRKESERKRWEESGSQQEREETPPKQVCVSEEREKEVELDASVKQRSNRVRRQSVRERRTGGSLPVQTFLDAHCEPTVVPT